MNDEAQVQDVAPPEEEKSELQIIAERVQKYNDMVIEGLMGPIREFYAADDISEIMINGPKEIYIEQGGSLHCITMQLPEGVLA